MRQYETNMIIFIIITSLMRLRFVKDSSTTLIPQLNTFQESEREGVFFLERYAIIVYQTEASCSVGFSIGDKEE